MTDEQDDEGQVLTHTSHLSARPFETVEGYSLHDDDFFLPGGTCLVESLRRRQQAPQSDEIIKSPLQMHHIHVDILATMCWPGIMQAQPSVLFVALETQSLKVYRKKDVVGSYSLKHE